VDELQRAGIIGLLFGSGAGGVSNYNDAQNDGVTNPPPFCTGDGISSGQACNNHASTVADDDGGYLRMAAQQYYANPAPVAIAPVSSGGLAAPPSTQHTASALQAVDLGGASIDPPVAAPGQQVTANQDAVGDANGTVRVRFDLLDRSGARVASSEAANQRMVLGFVLASSASLSLPDSLPPGKYALATSVLSDDGSAVYASNPKAAALTVVPASDDAASAAADEGETTP